MPANASDVVGSLAKSSLHTNARHESMSELQNQERSQVAAGSVARILHS